MKVLVTSTPGLGHILAMVPLVRELHDRGHEVRWIGGHVDLDDLVALRIPVHRAGMPEAERQRVFRARHPEVASIPAAERQLFAFPRVFGELAASEMVEPVASVADQWAPDVILHDAAELAAPLVAASLGIASVSHGFGQIVPEPAVRAAGEVLAPRWRAAGLAPDPYAGSYRGLHVDIYPSSLRDADMAHVPRVQPCRPTDGAPSTGGAVYVTFGTLFNEEADALRTAVLAAADVADDVVVTLGHGPGAAMLGAVPDHVRVEAFVPQADLLPRCAAVVCHGGSGTILASLAHAIPVVCMPQGADQFANAANVERVGVGRSVATGATRAVLTDAIDHVLHGRAPRRAAVGLAGEIAAMPDRAEVARAIEAFVSGA